MPIFTDGLKAVNLTILKTLPEATAASATDVTLELTDADLLSREVFNHASERAYVVEDVAALIERVKSQVSKANVSGSAALSLSAAEIDFSPVLSNTEPNEKVVADYLFFKAQSARLKKNARQREYSKRTGYSAGKKSNKNNTRQIALRFSKTTDAEVLKKLDEVPNKNDYVRQLILRDVKK